MPISATASRSSRVASRARPNSVRLIGKQGAECDQADDAGGKLRQWHEDAAEVDCVAGEQRSADALEVAAEGELRGATQQNGEPEGDEDLHHAAVEPHRKGARYQQVIDRHA